MASSLSIPNIKDLASLNQRIIILLRYFTEFSCEGDTAFSRFADIARHIWIPQQYQAKRCHTADNFWLYLNSNDQSSFLKQIKLGCADIYTASSLHCAAGPWWRSAPERPKHPGGFISNLVQNRLDSGGTNPLTHHAFGNSVGGWSVILSFALDGHGAVHLTFLQQYPSQSC